MVKKAIAKDTPPDRCFNPVPDGMSGNMKLPRDCVCVRISLNAIKMLMMVKA